MVNVGAFDLTFSISDFPNSKFPTVRGFIVLNKYDGCMLNSHSEFKTSIWPTVVYQIHFSDLSGYYYGRLCFSCLKIYMVSAILRFEYDDYCSYIFQIVQTG